MMTNKIKNLVLAVSIALLTMGALSAQITQFPSGSGTSVASPSLNGAIYTDASGNLYSTPTGGAGTLCFVETNGGTPSWGACSGSAATAFSAITAGTNTAALVMGTGGSLSTSGTGTIAATSVTGLSVTATKTLTASNTLTLTGTDGSSVAFGTGGTVLYANQTITLTGDTTGSGTTAITTTTSKVNGVSYGTSPSTNTVPVVTGTNAITYEAVPNAALANSAITFGATSQALGSTVTNLNAINVGPTTPGTGAFTTLSASSTVTFSGISGSTQCLHVNSSGTVTGTGSDCGSGGSTAFSALTGSTNTTAAMLVGTGASLGATGSGSITATAMAVGGLTGLGTGVGTWLATPSGANLASALTTPLPGSAGGTGVANTGFTITLAGNLTTTGAFNTVFVQGGSTTQTLPTTSQTIPGMNQTNTAGASFTWDMHSATSAAALRLPNIAGATSATNGVMSYDTTNNNLHAGSNSADNIIAVFPSASIPTNGHCVQWGVTSNVVTLADTGSACGSGGAGALSALTAAVGANSINNGDNKQTWNWDLTTSGKTAFLITENSASTAAGTPYLLGVTALAGSTATPVNITNSLTGSQTLPTLSITPTWNVGSTVVDAALLINVTNTGSGATSKLIDAQVGGTSEWNVDRQGNSTQNGTMTTGSGSGIAGAYQCQQGTAVTPASNAFGWTCPTSMTTSVLLQSPNAVPAASQVMLFPAPTSNVSQFTWTNFTLTGMGSTFSAPLSLSGNTVTCSTCLSTTGSPASPQFAIFSASTTITNSSLQQPTAGQINASASSSTNLIISGGQDGNLNSTLGNLTLRGGNVTGAGGGSSVGGGLLLAGGANQATNATSSAGTIEIVAGQSTGATGTGLQGLLVIAHSFAQSSTTTQWNAVCTPNTAQSVQDCPASPAGAIFVGIAMAKSGSVEATVATAPSEIPMNFSNSAVVGHTVCLGSSSPQVTDSGTTTACKTGVTIGVVEAVGNSYVPNGFPDGTAFPTLSSSLALVKMQSPQDAVVGPSATATSQLCTSSGANKNCSWIDFPERYMVPAANCNNTTAGAGWSIGSGGTVTCRAGTNNLGGYITITDTSSTFAQFALSIPADWDTSTDPYILFGFTSASDTTNGHTVKPQIAVSCPTATNGTVNDDHSFATAHTIATVTFGASAVTNGFYTGSGQTNSTDMTGCVAGGMMIIQVGRASDTATGNINFYYADVTFPRLLVVQAN